MIENQQKIITALQFYMLATKLKDVIRTGWKIWNVDRQRLESVAEHIYGTCILAIALESEFKLEVDLQKVIMMLVLHETEEVLIGDITVHDDITREEKRMMGIVAVEKVLETLAKKEEYIELINEFEDQVTQDAKFAKMCDKIECLLQVKAYCEEGSLVLGDENQSLVEQAKIKSNGATKNAKTVAEIFIEFDKYKYKKDFGINFEEILDFIKNNEIHIAP